MRRHCIRQTYRMAQHFCDFFQRYDSQKLRMSAGRADKRKGVGNAS
jgi:hypothetical protein